MNINIQKFNMLQHTVFKNQKGLNNSSTPMANPSVLSVYGDDEIRTNPAQLSLFHMHDFHGQSIRMERAYSAIEQFDKGELTNQDKVFDKSMPIDRLKFCSGDMFLGENKSETEVVNEFLNIAGIVANTVGNHECDTFIDDFTELVKNRKYHFLGANMHPVKENSINSILSGSLIVEINGNKYGIIGLVPEDMADHMKRPEEVDEFNISELNETVEDLKQEISRIKENGVNKIILLSHLGLPNEKYIAQNVSDIDIILGGHTHNLITEVIPGENLFTSPKGEPVLIMQVGRDGEFIGVPNIKFNELGQIEGIQYNVLDTDKFGRSIIAKHNFEDILGKPEVVGEINYAEEPPKDIYANENPHCNFILDCMKEELGTDIAIMNSANIRSKFYEGKIDTRDLRLISPFANKVVVIRATEKEIIDGIKKRLKVTMESPVHRPGVLQVSGIKYEFMKDDGTLTHISFVDKDGIEHDIDIDNPDTEKFYTIATDDYCAISKSGGLDLKHRVDEALQKFECDKDEFVASYLRKQDSPVQIKSDGRIKPID